MQTQNTEKNKAVDDITDRIVELEKPLVPLQIAVENTNTDLEIKET